MSTPHATTSLWQREEDGSYRAETAGCVLHVRWQPGARLDAPHGFWWEVTPPSGAARKSEVAIEEPEVAMAWAEVAAAEAAGKTNTAH